ncbi:hypothetical protein F4819DRAFT_385747 [Hypoxylon fuscum]|nr:hypothetical protein F4819DRAFT_385747 [Hypoxylon fuscum]
MSLTQLPFEILNDILSRLDDQNEREYADNGFPTLCALALTCRRLSEIVTNLLYSNIKLVINGRGAKDTERTKTLNKCCRETPSLVNRIHSSDIRWFSREDLEAYDEFLGHLATSTSLTRLKSELNHDDWTVLPALYKFTKGSFPHLTHLDVELNRVGGKEGYLPAEQLASLCELPSLERLSVYAPVSGFKTNVRPKDILPNLTHLHFWGSRPVSVEILDSLLPRTPNLTCLQLGVPGEATQIDRKMADNTSMLGYDLDEPLRPAFYGDLLAPVAANLNRLVLDVDNITFPSHEESRINLSRFTNLTQLDLSISLLFGSGPPWARDVWKCLPPRVEKLQLLFHDYSGLFWSLVDMRRHARSQTFDQLWSERLDMNHVDWLVELLDRNRDNMPSFRSITIVETPVVDRDQNWKIVQWHMTDDLTALARAAGVELVIMLRVPRNFESPEVVVWEESWAYGEGGTVEYEQDNVDEELIHETEE